MTKNLPIYEVKINEDDDETGVSLVSLVDRPAMQVQGLTLSEQTEPVVLKLEAEQDEMTMTSAIIIPDKLIYRSKPTERYIVFTADDIKKIRNKFMRRTGNLRLSNKNHVQDDLVDAYLIESWVITDASKDKAVALGFDLPVGTWMATYQIKDRKFWDEEVKTGHVTGFSLEGLFEEHEVQLTEEEAILAELTEIMGELAHLLTD